MDSEVFYSKAFGYILSSSIYLPYEELVNPPSPAHIDIEIRQGQVSKKGLNNPMEKGLFWQTNPDEYWFEVPHVARFLIQGGQTIYFEANAAIDIKSLSVFLTGPCMAALLTQRNLFVLSGGVLKSHDSVFVYLGGSCTGKSSLLALMLQEGYSILSDDLCVITKEGLVLPGLTHIELWQNTADTLNIPINKTAVIRPQLQKYRVPLKDHFCNKSLPLKEFFVLHPQKKKGIYHQRLKGSEKLSYLNKNIYNKSHLAGPIKHQLYFQFCAQLAQQIPMHLIEFNGLEFDMVQVGQRLHALQESEYA